MSTKTVAISGTGLALTGPAHVVRISAIGPDGAIVNFYDTAKTTGKTQDQAALTLKNMGPWIPGVAPAPASVTSPDCAEIPRQYAQVGVGYGADTTIAAAVGANLPIVFSVPNGTAALDVDVVVARGLYAEVLGGAAQTTTLLIEYYPNIAAS